MRRSRVHILGGSGSGTTTLGRALADAWSVPHADADDYFWVPTDPPYTTKRPPAERVELMRRMFLGREAWVLSGSAVGWGDEIIAHSEAIVLLILDPVERMRRLEVREQRRRPEDDPAAWEEFRQWARGYDDPAFEGRSHHRHEAYLAGLPQPVLRLDAVRPVAALCAEVLAWEPSRVTPCDGTGLPDSVRAGGAV